MLLLRRSLTTIAGLLIIIMVIICAIFAEALAPQDPLKVALYKRLSPPSKEYPLGSDHLGRDVLSRIIYGSRPSLLVGLGAVSFGLLLGGSLGIIGGYTKLIGDMLMRIVDFLMCFPSIVLAIAVVAVLGPGLTQLIIAIGIASVPQYARLAYASTLSVKAKDFVIAAQALGASHKRIIIKHILPNIAPPLLVSSTLSLATAIITEAGLSFLGVGIQPPTPTWGLMLSEGKAYIREAPWLTIVPGTAIAITVLGFNLVGDGLRDILDPRLRRILKQ